MFLYYITEQLLWYVAPSEDHMGITTALEFVDYEMMIMLIAIQ